MHLVFAIAPEPYARRPHRRHPHRAGLLPQPRHHRPGPTRWSTPTSRRPTPRWRERRADDARAGDARLGAGRRHRPAGRADRAPRRAATSGGCAATRSSSSTTACSRTSPPRCSSRTSTPHGAPTAELRPRPVRPRRPHALRAGLRRRRVPGAHPRARQPRRARVPRHLRARRSRSTAAATRATTSPTSSSSIRPTCPGCGALNVTANVTPLWAQREDSVELLTLPFVSDAVARTIYPFASIHAAGGRIAFGSDWSVSTPEPLEQLATAVHRARSARTHREPLSPSSASTSTRRSRRTPSTAPTSASPTTAPAASRSASWPTWCCSIATCSPAAARRDHRRPDAADAVRGRGRARRRRLGLAEPRAGLEQLAAASTSAASGCSGGQLHGPSFRFAPQRGQRPAQSCGTAPARASRGSPRRTPCGRCRARRRPAGTGEVMSSSPASSGSREWNSCASMSRSTTASSRQRWHGPCTSTSNFSSNTQPLRSRVTANAASTTGGSAVYGSPPTVKRAISTGST